jgi:hypothetical protein
MAQIGFSYTGFINIAAGATVEFWITGPFGADTYNHVLPTSAFSGIEGSEGRLQAYDLLVLATRMTRGGQFEAPCTTAPAASLRL